MAKAVDRRLRRLRLIQVKAQGIASATILSNDAIGAAGGRIMEFSMFDLMMIAISVAFFVVAIGYVVACDRM
jgi:hypothetical protein